MKIMMQFFVLVISLFASSLVIAECTTNRNIDIAITKPDSRYTDNNDGTIKDTKTGLLWQKCSVGFTGGDCTTATSTANVLGWYLALVAAKISGTAGHSDWRLPSKNELFSLTENACSSPSINQTIFPNTASGPYWTSSPSVQTADNAWTIEFTSGGKTLTRPKTLEWSVRLVRDDIINDLFVPATGEDLFVSRCQRCHGVNGAGTPNIQGASSDLIINSITSSTHTNANVAATTLEAGLISDFLAP